MSSRSNIADVVADLTRAEYELFRRLIYQHSGINLGPHKMPLLRARLGKRLRQGGFRTYQEYYEHVQRDRGGQALCELIDAVATNTTHLFRERQHFDFLAATLAAWAADRAWRAAHRAVRLWSAACSSGEEPHSIAMTAHDVLRSHPDLGLKILATDISTRVLARAKEGRYEPQRLGTVPDQFRRRYFTPTQHNGTCFLELVPELRRLITFARLNLMSPSFPFRHKFHFIFCRNTMIYFDRPTQAALVNKFTQHLHTGGYLLIGHSESLNALRHSLVYVKPTIYQKRDE